MTDLSHWDFEEFFTAKEIAALVRGIDPAAPDAPEIRVNDPVLRRVVQGYDKALTELTIQWHATIDFDVQACRDEMDSACLRCKAMYIEWGELFREVFERGMLEHWEQQEFGRSEIARWLSHMGFFSKYSFLAKSESAATIGIEIHLPQLQRPKKGEKTEDRAQQVCRIASELGFGHPREIEHRRGSKPGPKANIWAVFNKQFPGISKPSFDAAWTFARKPQD